MVAEKTATNFRGPLFCRTLYTGIGIIVHKPMHTARNCNTIVRLINANCCNRVGRIHEAITHGTIIELHFGTVFDHIELRQA